MHEVAVGKLIAVEGRGPPWIVAYDSIEAVHMARWPGKLWRVEIVDAASREDQNGQVPLPYVRYTRAVAVRIFDEVDAAVLFGQSGDNVVKVLDAASILTKSQAATLAENRHEAAASAYDRCFRSWLAARDLPHMYCGDFDRTLQTGSTNPCSPVGFGLSLADRCVFDRAVEIDGKDATDQDDDDMWLVGPWDGAATAFIDAVLGIGAVDVPAEDANALLHSWRVTFADQPELHLT